jgi:glycosyltransferase involved in cell wall biosynthesis
MDFRGSPLKIIHIGPVYPYRGGISHYVASLTKTLSKDYEVEVISFRSQFPKWLYPGSSDKDPSHQKHEVEAEYLLSPLDPLSWMKTIRTIQENHPDFIIIHWWVTYWSIANAVIASSMRKLDIPVLFLIHNVFPHESHWWDKSLARIGLRKGYAFIVHTENESKKLKELIPDAEVSTCPLPLFDFTNSQGLSKEAARSELDLPQQVPILLFFGIVRPYKGLDILLEAITVLKKTSQEIFLVVAGEIWEGKRRYRKKITANKLSEHVILIDQYIPNESLPLYFSAADAFVAPYIGGTASAALALALNFGIPSITTEHIASGISLPDDAHLSVCRAGDVQDLANKINSALNIPGVEYFPSSHTQRSWDNMVETITHFWRNLGREQQK